MSELSLNSKVNIISFNNITTYNVVTMDIDTAIIRDDDNNTLVIVKDTDGWKVEQTVEIVNSHSRKFSLNKKLKDTINNNNIILVDNLISNGESSLQVALDDSAYNGYTDIVELLLERHSFDVIELNLALTSASYSGYIDIVKLLLRSGANDLNKAMQMASEGKHYDIVNFLAKIRANIPPTYI